MGALVVIDTNLYSKFVLGDNQAYDVIRTCKVINVPIFVIAELKFGFLGGTRKEDNTDKLNRFISQDNVNIMVPSYETSNMYAELADFCKKTGRVFSQNDIWIAALALEHNLPLATYDKDFMVFEGYSSDLRINILK